MPQHQENTLPSPSSPVTELGEQAPPSQLHHQLALEYISTRAHYWAGNEASAWRHSFDSSTHFVKDGYSVDLGATTADQRRRLLRTAEELGISEKHAFAAMRIGSYATNTGEIAISPIGDDSGLTREHRLTSASKEPVAYEHANLPGDKVMHELLGALDGNQQSFISQESIAFNDDPELFSSLITHSQAFSLGRHRYERIDNHKSVEKLYASLEPIMPGEEDPKTAKPGMYFNEQNQVKRIVLPAQENSPYHYVLEPVDPAAQTSLTEGEYRIGFVVDTSKLVLETGNNNNTEAPAFIFSPDAQSICNELESAGLSVTQNLKDILVGEVENRYGHAYSHLTLALCDVVNKGDKELLNLFNAESVEDVKQKLQHIGQGSEAPTGAAVVFDLLRSIANRDSESELPVASSEQLAKTKLSGLCKDVESYYAGALGERKLATLDENGVPILEKRDYGVHTFMLRRPTKFNGVELPAGTVMAKLSTGWAAGRISAYTVANHSPSPIEEALRVFGAQMDEMLGSKFREKNTAQFMSVNSLLS